MPPARMAGSSHPLPCLLPVLGKTEKLVTCKTGAVFWGSHTEYCGQQWRGEKETGREEREATVVISHAEGGASPGSITDAPKPRPRPLCLGTERSAAAPPSGTGKQRPVYLDTGVSAWSGSHARRGSEA